MLIQDGIVRVLSTRRWFDDLIYVVGWTGKNPKAGRKQMKIE
jgi:hypothetical protein